MNQNLFNKCLGYGRNVVWHFECFPVLSSVLAALNQPKPPTPTTTHPTAPTTTRPTAPQTTGAAGANTTHTPSSPQAPSTTSPRNSPPPNTSAANSPPTTATNPPPNAGIASTSSQPAVTNGPEGSPTQPSPNSGPGSNDNQSSSGANNSGALTSLPPGERSTTTGPHGVAFPTQITSNSGAGSTGTDSLRPLGIASGDPPSATNTFVVGGVGAANKSTTNTGAIVGGVLGALAVLALLILALLLMRRRRRQARVAPSAEFMQRFANSPSLQTTHGVSGAPYSDDQTNLPSYSQGQYPFVIHEKSTMPMYR